MKTLRTPVRLLSLLTAMSLGGPMALADHHDKAAANGVKKAGCKQCHERAEHNECGCAENCGCCQGGECTCADCPCGGAENCPCQQGAAKPKA